MYQYRQILVRMRQGDSDRDIARAKTMGRKKVAQLRETARERDWLKLDECAESVVVQTDVRKIITRIACRFLRGIFVKSDRLLAACRT